MDAWKYEIYFSHLNRISRSFALLTCEIPWSTLKINLNFQQSNANKLCKCAARNVILLNVIYLRLYPFFLTL